MATKHDDSVKGGELPELTKAVREGDVATAGACGFARPCAFLAPPAGPRARFRAYTPVRGGSGKEGELQPQAGPAAFHLFLI